MPRRVYQDPDDCECGRPKSRRATVCYTCQSHERQKNTSDPTPDQIRMMCEEIQKTWTERERKKRHWQTRITKDLFKVFRTHINDHNH